MTDLNAAKPEQLNAVAIDPETKPLDPDDPMEMKAAVIAGDEHLMMECLIEEFAHLGWGAKKIAKMFDEPFFLSSHGLEKQFGRKAVLECIEQTLARCGIFRFEMEESLAGNKKPLAENKEPSAGKIEPSARNMEPSAKNMAPSAPATDEIQVIRIQES